MPTREATIIDRFLGLFIMITIVIFFSGAYLGIQTIGLYILTPILFLISILRYRNHLNNLRKEFYLFFSFVILALLSFYYPNFQTQRFLDDFPKVAASLMAAFIPIALGKSKKFENYFHFGFVFCLIFLVFFEYLAGNFSLKSFYSPEVSRGELINNANYYSYLSLFANFSLFRLHLKFRNKITFVSLIILPILMIAMSFVTQSRSGLLFIILINAVFWYWVIASSNKKSYIKIIRMIGLSLITIFLAFRFIEFYNKSSIKTRIEASARDSREVLLQEGIEVFMTHPFLGVGMGQFPRYSRYNQFTHNTYVEALAEHGIIIGSILILVFIVPFFDAVSLIRKNSKNEEVKLTFLFFFIFLLFNNIYVFYKASPAMMFFFLMISIQYNLMEKISLQKKQVVHVS